MLRILIADDHPLFRRALAAVVAEALAGCVVLEADSLASARALLHADADVDLVLLDLHMPGSHGLMGLAAIRAEYPGVAVAVVSAHDDADVVVRAQAFGAAGFISKGARADDLLAALKNILAGEAVVPEHARSGAPSTADRALAARLARLSPQQFRVLTLVAEGKLNKQIAAVLGVQERTVKAHLSAIFERLGVRNRTQAGVMLRSLEVSEVRVSLA